MQSKHEALKNLERSAQDIETIFEYLAALVEEQAHALENIDDQVDQTAEYVDETTVLLEKAKEHKDIHDHQKFSMIMWVVGFLLIVFVLLPLVWKCCGSMFSPSAAPAAAPAAAVTDGKSDAGTGGSEGGGD